MHITQSLHSYDLNEYTVRIAQNHELVFESVESSGSTPHAISYSLVNEQIILHSPMDTGQSRLTIGKGDLLANGDYFKVHFQPRQDVEAFVVTNDRTAIGVGDWRDLRVTHTYDLGAVPIAITSDGIYLTILCPGDGNDSSVTWYSKVEEKGN